MSKPAPTSKPPALRRRGDGRLVLEADTPRLDTALGLLLRKAVTLSSSEADCARRCGVSIAELRAVSALTRVPLLFAAPGAGKAAGA